MNLPLASVAEAIAVVLALAYLVLAIRQHPLCWPAAMLSAAIYIALMAGAGLYMQSLLQVFYIGMALWGWYCWTRPDAAQALPVRCWPARRHALALTLLVSTSLITGFLLSRQPGAVLPWLDAFTACGALVATALTARKVLESWHYWFVIDLASLYLYASQGLWLTAGLFGLYLVLIVRGYLTWRADPALVADRQ